MPKKKEEVAAKMPEKKPVAKKAPAKKETKISFTTYAIYHSRQKKFISGVEYALTGRVTRKLDSRKFLTFVSAEEAAAAFKIYACTSVYRIVELKFDV